MCIDLPAYGLRTQSYFVDFEKLHWQKSHRSQLAKFGMSIARTHKNLNILSAFCLKSFIQYQHPNTQLVENGDVTYQQPLLPKTPDSHYINSTNKTYLACSARDKKSEWRANRRFCWSQSKVALTSGIGGRSDTSSGGGIQAVLSRRDAICPGAVNSKVTSPYIYIYIYVRHLCQKYKHGL